MRCARWALAAGVVLPCALAVSACELGDLLGTPGTKPVVVQYLGDTLLVAAEVTAPAASATADGSPIPGARFAYASSDTSILAINPGEALAARARGTAALTVALADPLLPQNPPSVTRTIRVVAASLTLDLTSATLKRIGDTLTLHATPLNALGQPIAGSASWQSSDTTVVAVSQAGLLTALATGAATVRAFLDLDTAACQVTVR